MSIGYVAVVSDGVTRYASLTEFLASVSGLDATFGALSTPPGDIVAGPTQAKFNAVSAASAKASAATVAASSALDALETRIALLEGKRHAPEFDAEFSAEFD